MRYILSILSVLYLIVAANAQGFSVGSPKTVPQIALVQAPVNTTIPIISGSPYQGDTLTVSMGNWINNPTNFHIQWYDQTLATVNGLKNNTVLTPINGATNASYTIQASDAGAWLLPIITAVNSAGSTQSIPVYPVGTVPATQSLPPTNTAAPSIQNSPPLVGSGMTVTTGTWSNGPIVTYNYVWCSNNTTAYPPVTGSPCPAGYNSIPAPDSNVYTIQTADMGTTPNGSGSLVVEVQAVNAVCGPNVSSCPWAEGLVAGNPVKVLYSTIVPGAGTTPITIKGTASIGNVLSPTTTSTQLCNNSSSTYTAWTGPGTSNGVGSCSYQWQDCNVTSCTNSLATDATTQSFTITKLDIGYAIKLIATGCNNEGCGTQCSDIASGNIPCGTIPSTPVVPAEPISAPVISAPTVSITAGCSSNTAETTPVVGYCLKAAVGTTTTNNPLNYNWQWLRGTPGSGTPISGATSYDYALQAADVGQTLYVQNIAQNDAGVSAPVNSAATAAVTELPPVNTAVPIITGLPVSGGYLQASNGTFSNSPTLYVPQWCSSSIANSGTCPAGTGPIPGATSFGYTIASAYVGYQLAVAVTASNNASYGGGSASAASALTAVVSNTTGLPANTVAPSITGVDNVGATLTANVGTYLPTASSYVYNWFLNGVLVGTGSTYVPTDTGTVSLNIIPTNSIGTAPPVSATSVTITSPPVLTATQTPGWGIASATIVSGGTGYSQALTYVTFAGGSCPTEPALGLIINDLNPGNGPITIAYVSSTGAGCLTPPTATLQRGGTGGSITVALNNLPYVNQPIQWSNGIWTPTTSAITYSYGVCSIATTATFDTNCSNGTLHTFVQGIYVPRAADLGNNLYFLVYATNASGTVISYIESGAPVTNSPIPVALPSTYDTYQPPTIVGTTAVGNDLYATLGTWTVGGSSAISTVFYPTGNNQAYPIVPAFSFQWYQGTPGSGTPINCTTYPNACRQIYTLQPSDQGHTIYYGVIANTSGGNSAVAYSAATLAVAAFPSITNGCGGWASSTYWDGCKNAPLASSSLIPYQVQHATFFNGYAQQNGQSYISTNGCKGEPNCHPPWAVAGVDYPVGVSTTGTCPNPTVTNGCFAQPGGNTDPTNFSSPNYNGNPAGCYQPTLTSTGWNASWTAGVLTLTYEGGSVTYIGGKIILSGFTPTSLNGTYTGVLGDQIVKGASFTLPILSNPGTITTGSILAYENTISCPGPTNQPVNIGPFDFSYQGNPGGVALSLEIGAGVWGPCNIHDNYAPIDLNSTHMPNSSEVNIINGCSSLVFMYNKMNIRDPLNTSNTYPFWYGYDNQNLVWMALAAGTSNSEQANRPVIAEYNAFSACNARCFAANNFDIRNNYYEGVNINASGASAAHGDGIIASGYNGPTNPEASQQCNCSGYNQAVERGDTWLQPAYGAGTTTCLTCVAIQVPAFTLYGWSSGDNLIHVTSVYEAYPTQFPDVGAPIGSGNGSITQAFPAITQCKTASGIIGCNNGQAASCSPTAPCIYTMTSNMQPCFATLLECGYNLNFPADWIDVEYTNNVYVTDLVNATGSGEEAPGGPGGGAASTITYMSYMRVSYGTFSNNYIDSCGSTTNAVNTGWPYYQCPIAPFPAIPSFGATGAANLSMIATNNVSMTNGQCVPVFGEKSPPNDCY